MFVLDGKQLVVGRPFTGTDGTQYPANWLNLTTLAEKEAIGITEVADPVSYNTVFWDGYDDDNNLKPKLLDDVGVGAAKTTGLKTLFNNQQTDNSWTILNGTDWYITRNAETGAVIPVGITSFRTEVRSVCAERQAMISATVDVGQLQSLVTGAGTSSIVGYTTTLLPNWPNLSDYT